MTVEEKIQNITPYAEMMPGVIIIHELRDFRPVFMSRKGLEGLGITLEELKKVDRNYHEKFFNNDEMEDVMRKFERLLQNKDPEETFTLFQQVKLANRENWVWHITSVRIFHQDAHGNVTHTISLSFPVDQMKHIPNKAERLLAENEFFRKNLNKYLSLGTRAKEVLKLVALGKSSAEIADELCISVDTVNTHRKKIKKKLGIYSTYEFTEYAHAYDLI